MLKTKLEFQSDYLMTEEQSKRHDEYIKKHKPKGLSEEEAFLIRFLNKKRKKRGRKKDA